MKSSKLLSLFLSAFLLLTPMTSFAYDEESAIAKEEGQSTEINEEHQESSKEATNKIDAGKEKESPQEATRQKTAKAIKKAPVKVGESQAVEWESGDFTYAEIEKLIYGCDYSRQINIKGIGISGFSAEGEKKFEKSKDIVLPREDTEGNTLVGVCDGAFKNKGITSVKFPSGMLVPYKDELNGKVTKRGNFLIMEGAFAGNKIKKVNLPNGVMATMPYAFQGNEIEEVTFPKTIWWIESMAFAKNKISRINFPETVDFRLEIHGVAFGSNNVKSIRLPDYTEVVNKDAFFQNPGMVPCPKEAPDKQKENGGVVYMYTDNPELQYKDRIHTIDKTTASTKSWHQKLITNDGSAETANPDKESWNIDDFTVSGTTITGLSQSGILKRKTNKNLVLPSWTKDGRIIKEIADSTGQYGLFATADEKFDTVVLPDLLEKVGNKAFANNGVEDVTLAPGLKEIGFAAFQNNNLTSVVLPDSVTKVGGGAFATNPQLSRIILSSNLTEIPDGMFGCSDASHWMKNLTKIEIPEKVTKIGKNAFAGNNFTKIEIPANVKTIGDFAFSTKNYLKTPCELKLNEGLEKIGKFAFRNKIIEKVDLPATVQALPKNVFTKAYSNGESVLVTKVFVKLKSQYEDKTNFPEGEAHKLYLTETGTWTAEDFTYGEMDVDLYPAKDVADVIAVKAHVVTGFSDMGLEKIKTNKNLIIPAKDPSGKQVQGVGAAAFKGQGLTGLELPKDVYADHNGKWNANITKRGDFHIGGSAFLNNKLKTVELPEGVITIGGNAFKQNELTAVTFPKTVMLINNGAFAQNDIANLKFENETDFPLQFDNLSFAKNKIKAVALPKNTEKLTKWTFLQNVGKEPVTNGTAAEKKGGIVHIYNINIGDDFIETVNNSKSNVQKIMTGSMPEEDTPWGMEDFTYAGDGITITGLTDKGKAKIKINPDVVIPSTTPTGAALKNIGDGTFGIGIFNAEEGGKTYTATSVELPNSIEKIGKQAFSGLPSESIDLPNNLKEIGLGAFQGSKLKEVVIPDSVTEVGAGAFSNSAGLTKAKISKNLKIIPQAMFSMTALKDIEIPEGITEIGNSSFAGTRAATLKLPKSLEKIGKMAFMNHQFSEVIIPENVKEIGDTAFALTQESLKSTLTSLTLPGSVEKIGRKAFGKSSLKSLELPKNIKELSKNAFDGNTVNGKDYKVQLLTNDQSKTKDDGKFIAQGTGHEVVYNKLANTGWTADDFTYQGQAVTGLSASGIEKRKTMRELVIPDVNPNGEKITEIGDKAFKVADADVTIRKFDAYSPNGLLKIDLPENLRIIGEKAFEYNSLTQIDFPKSLEEIKGSAFHGNRIEKVELPESAVNLGSGVFSMNNITELQLPKDIKIIPSGAFSMNIRMEQLNLPDGVTEIGQTAFAGARLTSLEIPKSVKKIGLKAFHLHRMTELTIPGNVVEIGESAFEGTYKAQTLKKLTIEEGVEKIGKYAFKEGLLEKVNLPKSIKEMGEEPFMNNTGVDKSHVVYLYTKNKAHLDFAKANYHKIIFEEAKKALKHFKDVSGNEFLFKDGVYQGEKLEKKARPYQLTVTAKPGRKMLVEWTNCKKLGADIDGYIVTRKVGSSKVFSEYKRIPANTNYLVDILTKKDTNYYYMVFGYKKDAKGNLTISENSMSAVGQRLDSAKINPYAPKLNYTKKTIRQGESVKLRLTYPKNSISTWTRWRTHNDAVKVAKVNQQGVVTGVNKGKVLVSARTPNGRDIRCLITVI